MSDRRKLILWAVCFGMFLLLAQALLIHLYRDQVSKWRDQLFSWLQPTPANLPNPPVGLPENQGIWDPGVAQDEIVAPDALHCSLFPSVAKEVTADKLPLTFQLTNVSGQPCVISYHYWPHVHLTIEVFDSGGRRVLEFPYGRLTSILSPQSEGPKLHLAPGEMYSAQLDLAICCDNDRISKTLGPGNYTLRGVFRYPNTVVTSKPTAFSIKP
jgi:hypothetical protein